MDLIQQLKAKVTPRTVVRESNTMLEKRGIVASPDNEYRYVLWRFWGGEQDALCAFVMLNPSTADEAEGDPTITKCVGFTKRFGLSGLVVMNLFARRATHPESLLTMREPRGIYNGFYTRLVLDHPRVYRVVVAWGNEGSLDASDEAFFFMNTDRELWCLQPPGKEALTQLGAPRHPVRISYQSVLRRIGWQDGAVALLAEGEA